MLLLGYRDKQRRVELDHSTYFLGCVEFLLLLLHHWLLILHLLDLSSSLFFLWCLKLVQQSVGCAYMLVGLHHRWVAWKMFLHDWWETLMWLGCRNNSIAESSNSSSSSPPSLTSRYHLQLSLPCQVDLSRWSTHITTQEDMLPTSLQDWLSTLLNQHLIRGEPDTGTTKHSEALMLFWCCSDVVLMLLMLWRKNSQKSTKKKQTKQVKLQKKFQSFSGLQYPPKRNNLTAYPPLEINIDPQ